jgi:hypothetical protein
MHDDGGTDPTFLYDYVVLIFVFVNVGCKLCPGLLDYMPEPVLFLFNL